MELALNFTLLLFGITILVWGANKFVDHSSIIAKHLGINDLVVGLTLIAAGTSAPEIFVAISAVINGNEDNLDIIKKRLYIYIYVLKFYNSIKLHCLFLGIFFVPETNNVTLDFFR